jgi:hypothetical protein
MILAGSDWNQRIEQGSGSCNGKCSGMQIKGRFNPHNQDKSRCPLLHFDCKPQSACKKKSVTQKAKENKAGDNGAGTEI